MSQPPATQNTPATPALPAPDQAQGLFETLLVLAGEPIELDAHLARLAASLTALFGTPEPRALASGEQAARAPSWGGCAWWSRPQPRPPGSAGAEVPPGRDVFPTRSVARPCAHGAAPAASAATSGPTAGRWRRRGARAAAAGRRRGARGGPRQRLRRDGALFTPADGRILPGIARAGAIAVARSGNRGPRGTGDPGRAVRRRRGLPHRLGQGRGAGRIAGRRRTAGGGRLGGQLAGGLRQRWHQSGPAAKAETRTGRTWRPVRLMRVATRPRPGDGRATCREGLFGKGHRPAGRAPFVRRAVRFRPQRDQVARGKSHVVVLEHDLALPSILQVTPVSTPFLRTVRSYLLPDTRSSDVHSQVRDRPGNRDDTLNAALGVRDSEQRAEVAVDALAGVRGGRPGDQHPAGTGGAGRRTVFTSGDPADPARRLCRLYRPDPGDQRLRLFHPFPS